MSHSTYLRPWVFVASLAIVGCGRAQLPEPVTQADAVAESPAGKSARALAPQAFAAAEKIREEAKALHRDGRSDEAEAAGEQALAAYNEAFALARIAQAEERMLRAQAKRDEAAEKLATLDRLHSEIAAEADAFEMRARVHLDKEEVKDVQQLSPERAKARRIAAAQLSAEARLLCLAAHLLNKDAPGLKPAQTMAEQVHQEVSQGSLKDDLYPRSAAARSTCLEVLTATRRPAIKKSPESATSDRLFTALTKTEKLFAYRDDRGIVVNLAAPLDKTGKLTETAQEALSILGGTAKSHSDFPLMVVAHTAQNSQKDRAEQMLAAASAALQSAGAREVTGETVLAAQPVVSPSVSGAAEKNERLEIVFVSKGR
jgi:hypothetical protein